MNYKKNLRQLKESEDWEKLLTESLSLYEDGNEDRYVIRMIVHAYEELDNEKDAIPFWEILAREEHHSEEFSKKLIEYHKRKGNEDAWLSWSKRLLNQSLRKKEYGLVEDIWMQLVEAKRLENAFAMEITERLLTQEQGERAYTLLDLLLLSLEDIPREALSISKRMLAMDPENLSLRKRTEGFYRGVYSACTETEHFLEKANIRKSDDVLHAIDYFEQLVQFCPGSYVSHKSWGIGKVRSVDLLFGKLFVDFSANPNHSIDLNRAFTMLEPLDKDDFAVRKIENPSQLKKLKQENPAELITMMLKGVEPLNQKRAKAMLEGIVGADEWSSFMDKAKKGAKAAGLQLTRKGSTYLFSHIAGEEETLPTLETIDSIKSGSKRMKALLRFAEEGLPPADMQEWTHLADALLKNDELTEKERTELLMIRKEITGDVSHFDNSLATLLQGLQADKKRELVENLSKRKTKKALFAHIENNDAAFAKAVFLQTSDDWLRGHALHILKRNENIHDIMSEVVRNPNKYPLCFLYLTELLLKESERPTGIEKPIIVFETLLEFMIQEEAEQKVRSRAKTIFNKFGFDLYRWTLETSSKEEVTVLLGMVKKHPLIESAEKMTLEKLAESRHPSLKEKPKESFFYATKEAIQKKQKELNRLVKVEIPANSVEIGKAARQGDLSENFDYIAAKEKQRKLIDRTSMLKKELSQVQPMEDVVFTEEMAAVGTRITVKSKGTGEVRNITILGPWDTIPDQGIISHTASLAQEILGKKVGETFFDSFHSEHLEILKVSKYGSNQ